MVSQPCAGQRLGCFVPTLAGVAPRPTPPYVQYPLAPRIEIKKLQYPLALPCIREVITAYEFVIFHASIGQGHRTPSPGPNPCTQRQTRAKYQRIQKVAVEAEVVGH